MLDENGFIVKARRKAVDRLTANIDLRLKPVVYMSDEELMKVPTGDVWVFDVECYVNFFYIAFKHLNSGKFVDFEYSPASVLNETKLRMMMWRFCLVSFNGNGYDMPIIAYALKKDHAGVGPTCGELKQASNYIIQSGPQYGTPKVTPFDFATKYKVKIEVFNHIDLFNVTPLEGSLKLYACRVHCERSQDLPFDEAHVLTAEDAAIVRPYCCNDLRNTELIYNELLPDLKLRADMSEEYGLDLRSKSDAQVAEAVINSELQKVLGYYPKKPTLKEGTVLQYNVPSFVSFATPMLQEMLSKIEAARFQLDGLGSPMWPAGLGVKEKSKSGKDVWKLSARIAKGLYKVGMGGLHSNEKSIAHVAGNGIIIEDIDATSFYPRIILNQRLFPLHLGEAFLKVYESIVNRRIEAKKAGNKKVADSLKITINGSFGKLGNKYSTLYAPQLMLQVTITGQLVLLMLIEKLELAGIEVISGNTDGIMLKYHESRRAEVKALVKEWEAQTAFEMEETRYLAVYSRDVNNYIAVKAKYDKITKQWTDQVDMNPEARFVDEQLGCKTKGTYSERGSALNSVLSKNPETLICTDAVLQFIINGTPVAETVSKSRDIRRYVAIKNVKGGGEKNGKYLGKVVRWYYPKDEPGNIAYVLSGNKVPKTEGARPAMDLPEDFPEDIDYDWYVKEAIDMLYDCGRLKKPSLARLF